MLLKDILYKVSIEAVKGSTDVAIQKMRVKELIESLPGFGAIRAIAVLDKAGISHTRRVQGLGVSQREKLQSELRGR